MSLPWEKKKINWLPSRPFCRINTAFNSLWVEAQLSAKCKFGRQHVLRVRDRTRRHSVPWPQMSWKHPQLLNCRSLYDICRIVRRGRSWNWFEKHLAYVWSSVLFLLSFHWKCVQDWFMQMITLSYLWLCKMIKIPPANSGLVDVTDLVMLKWTE